MAEEWRPGLLNARLRATQLAALENMRVALGQLATAVERQAKINARNGSHRYGTKTPAVKGQGPAVISGTLRRSIVHTPVDVRGFDFETRVGMAAGVYPPYGKRRTPSSKYAEYLETRLNYPFLLPAYRFSLRVAAPVIWRDRFGPAHWPRAR